jgi:choline dehydrogenase
VSVRTECLVEKVLFEGRRALGVRYLRGGGKGPRETVMARREIIVCAGALNTPRLLQVSGVGEANHLRAIGQDVIVASPGVGANLSDHYQVRLAARLRGVKTFNECASGLSLIGHIARWALGRPSILGMGPVPLCLFHRTHPGLDYPDLQMSFTPGSFREGETGRLDDYPGMTIGGYQQPPESRGYVRAKSTDVTVAPDIQPNYLDSETDCAAIVEVVRMARRLMRSPSFAPYHANETFPGVRVGESEADILSFVRQSGGTAFHHMGTAKMGPERDPMAVVDPALRLRGAEGLRIADCSIFPTPLSGNTNAPAMMIGEKVSDLVLGAAR